MSIHHECEGGIEKSVPRITDWHHEACRVMTKGDREGQVFLSHPHTNDGFFFSLSTNYLILYWKSVRLPEHPEDAEFQKCGMMTSFKHNKYGLSMMCFIIFSI